jgi:esterase/lipase superfamily enzyme
MPSHAVPKQLAAPATDDNNCKQALECRRVNHAQIDRRDRVGVMAQKRSPALRRRPAMADHVLGNSRFGDLEPKLEQFAVNAGCTPEPVLPAHPPNKFAHFATDPRTSRLTARHPTLICAKSCPMPAQDRVRPNHARQGVLVAPNRAKPRVIASGGPAAVPRFCGTNTLKAPLTNRLVHYRCTIKLVRRVVASFRGELGPRLLHQKFHRGCVNNRIRSKAVSRRAVVGALASTGAAFALGGCTTLAAGSRFDASRLSTNPTIVAFTTRKPVNAGRGRPWFGSDRGTLRLARVTLTPPSDERFSLSAAGLANWAIETVEPLPGQVGELIAEVEGRDILLFIHGFRMTFEGAALDAAHLSDGISFRGDTMMFSWPSKAGLFDYSYDRESAMWSRDAFERVLDAAMLSPTRSRIHMVAHSLGTMVTLEALRQLNARYSDAAADKVGAVVFASPDIDIDVFTSSIERLGPLAAKITVVTATNDRALALSGRLAGGITRVGAAEKMQLERLGLNVIDASDNWGIINHAQFLTNAEVRKVIRRAIEDSGRRAGLRPRRTVT